MKLLKSARKYLFYFILLSFVFIATSALAISKINTVSKSSQAPATTQVLSFRRNNKTFISLPVLPDNISFPIVSAQSALAVDLESGVALYEKEADMTLLPASTTKIITALVAMDYYPRDAILKVNSTKVDGQKMDLVSGEEIIVDALLRGLLIASANDAAEVLAQNYPGGRESFIAEMNAKAKEVNLENTYFTNPSGLDSDGHKSTARDLVRVSSYAMKNPYFSEIVGNKETTVANVDRRIVHKLVNINELVGSVEGVLGVKTGWTENAYENLVTYVERDGKEVMIAIMGSQDRFGETKELIEWIFANYSWEEVSIPD